MKFDTQFLVALILGLFLFSCGSESLPGDEEAAVASANTKWKIHAEMMVHLRTAEQAVAGFSASEGADYAALAGDLQEALTLLTADCTMTGAAHDALHEWLLPYMELVDNLGDAQDEASSEQVFRSLEAAFQEFNLSFE
ncbi:MAG: hypothetical protein GY930_17205 [bacterium]|nr:hypothetical protein [bacterium]